MSTATIPGPILLPTFAMARKAGVPAKWLREQAERGTIPGIKTGERGFSFEPHAAECAIRAMAGEVAIVGGK